MAQDARSTTAMIPQLQTRGVFLLYCTVEATGIRPAITAIDYARVDVGQIVKVVEPDGELAFMLEVPAIDTGSYDVLFRFAPADLCPTPQTDTPNHN
jgi:hypothetical protein